MQMTPMMSCVQGFAKGDLAVTSSFIIVLRVWRHVRRAISHFAQPKLRCAESSPLCIFPITKPESLNSSIDQPYFRGIPYMNEFQSVKQADQARDHRTYGWSMLEFNDS